MEDLTAIRAGWLLKFDTNENSRSLIRGSARRVLLAMAVGLIAMTLPQLQSYSQAAETLAQVFEQQSDSDEETGPIFQLVSFTNVFTDKNEVRDEDLISQQEVDEAEPAEIQLTNYLDALPPSPDQDNLTDDILKRLSALEKQLKKRDEADAKKAATFPTHRITGFLQLDTGYYDQTHKNIQTVGPGQDGTGFRRARFAVQGKVAVNTAYQMEVDFAAAGRPSFFDNYVEQQSLPYLGDVRIGQYLQPFSVDAMSGFRNLPFLERSLPFLAFVPFRRVGIMSSNQSDDDMTHWAYSVFRTGGFNNAPLGDSQFATDTGNIGGYSFSTRVTHLLFYDDAHPDECLWHIGAAYDFSQLGANDALGALSGTGGNAGTPAPFYQSKVLPEFGPLGYPQNGQTFGPNGTSAINGTPIFVDSGKYQASNFQIYGLETVYQSGAYSFQSEYMGTLVESAVGPIYYQGAYGEIMYRPTGEHRLYDRKLSALKNPIPFRNFFAVGSDGSRGWGALELCARWSAVDIRNPNSLNGHYYNSAANNFTSGKPSDSAGNGILNDVTLGLSWFLNAHTKLQFNWIHCMLDNLQLGSSTADLLVGRVQVDF